MRVVFQMDENINPKTDTTLLLIKEAQRRDHEIFIYTPNNLALKLNEPVALAKRIVVDDYDLVCKDSLEINLNDVDIVFVRQNPPFDMRYITTTYILEKADTLVVNNPTEIRNYPEKLIVSLFSEFAPPTLVTENILMIKDFFSEHRDIILKPLYSYGGNDVIRICDGRSIQIVVELMIAKYNCPIIAQLFCDNIRSDRRILLLDGKPIGLMRRVPKSIEEIRTNIRFGSTFEPTEMSSKDYEICNRIGSKLRERGLIFVGIDVLGDFLLEINTTSPTGIVQINELYGVSLHKDLWSVFEEKVYYDT
ncbi:MAG: glutathione synthase [Wolbachia endosymbiont of Fragariocoptes setiger]|nr:glutathione synthase [Wolbachia endosymbiont of Fragariocoptes setiger]